MKVLIFSSLLVVAIGASFLEEQGAKFQAFKLKHGKTYLNQAEEAKRFNIFKDNLRTIEEHNVLYEQGKVSYKQGITRFTDMTQEEFKSMLTLSVSKKPTLEATPYVESGLEVPTSIDWRERGQVTEVKDQGICQSCWAFAITGSTEAAYYRKTGKLVSLSEQQLVDCTTDLNLGCGGGYVDYTFPYVMQSGLQSESSYPYKGEDQNCKYNASSVVTKVSNYKSIESGNEKAIYNAVGNVGPVAAVMDAINLGFYDSGIIDGTACSTEDLDHAVLIVGYGTQNGTDFWIAKNSMGVSFGEDGYFRLARGRNACGIAEGAVYPTIY